MTRIEIIALSVVQGLITVFDTPTRHAFIVQMVEGKDDLGSAIALTSSIVTLARMLGRKSVVGLINVILIASAVFGHRPGFIGFVAPRMAFDAGDAADWLWDVATDGGE